MSNLDVLRGYVHFLHEREGVRHIRLTRTAQQGLARIVAKVKARSADASGSRRPPGDGQPSRPASPQQATPRSAVADERFPQATVVRPALAQVAIVSSIVASAPVETISGSTKVDQLRHLGERASVCVKCPHLAARRHNVVFGVGNPEAKLMFVGEGPGEEEVLKGEPFVGRAGQLLTKMIQAMGLTREDVYIANILKCRPDMPPGSPGNRKPTREEMETCSPYLRAQIEVIKPTAMVALGATAVEGLVGPVGTIGSLRGRFLEYRGVPVMPTYHPSYLLRNQSTAEKRKVWEDLLKVMERLEMPITEKQRNFFLSR